MSGDIFTVDFSGEAGWGTTISCWRDYGEIRAEGVQTSRAQDDDCSEGIA